MGYMGMGMQKWIYKMKPRKPFSMKRKDSFTKIPLYKRTFKIQPSKSSAYSYLLGVFLFLLFLVITISIIPKWMSYEAENHLAIIESEQHKNDFTFNFLMNSGKKRLKNGNLIGAYSEFKLAKAIFPKHKRLNQLFLETTTSLCLNKGLYRKYLDTIILSY